MKKKIQVIMILLLICIYPYPGSASLEEMDQLITHFNKTLNALSVNDPMVPSLILRLADALTKRGQFKQSEEIAQGCRQKCKAGRADMKRALFLYKSIQNKVSLEMRGHVFFQIGYINVLFENQKAAIDAYSKITRSNKWDDLKPKSYVALGELFYKVNKFSRAKFYFSKSLEFEFPDKGFVIYRVAWCNYHLNQLKLAVEDLFKLLQSPEKFLLKNEASGTKQIDELFHKEVAKDLATFLSKKNPQNKEIEMLYRLSPKDQRVNNIVYLAKELIRIGNKKKAIFLWKKILPKQVQEMDRLESHVWLFQLFVETNQPENVLKAIRAISQLWNTGVCQGLKLEGRCKKFKKQINQNMTLWRNENTSNLSNVLKPYLFYLLIFKDDIEATYQVAEIAQKLQLWQLSREKYNTAIKMQEKLIANVDGEQKQKASGFLETILIGYIKTTEFSKNKKWLLESYETYLRLTKNKSQWLKVFFLKAKLLYDQEDYKKASNDFISIALKNLEGGDASVQKMKIQSAHLAIDALVLIKDEARLEKISRKFAEEFPDQASHFMKVNRTSIMNQALALSKNPQRALDVLNRFDLSGATIEEKVKYYKNKIILLGQLRRVSDEAQLVDQLLEVKTLSKEDKTFALLRKFYLAELMLDFHIMYEISREFNLENLPEDQWVLRKAFFAELAEQDYMQYYDNFLKLSKDSQKKFDIALRLFKKAPDQDSFFKQYKDILSYNPKSLSDVLLDNYINDINKDQMEQVLKGFTATDAGKVIWRDKFLKELGAVARQISQHQIRTGDVNFVADDVKERLKLFKALEEKALIGINAKDLIGQLIAFYFIKKEALRIYEDLISITKSISSSESQQKEYLSILKKQAQLYKEKATMVESQLKTLFDGSQIFDKLKDYFSQVSKPVKIISKSHLALLVNYLPEKSKPKLRAILKDIAPEEDEKKPVERPSQSVIEAVQEDIRKSPFNRRHIKKLIALEELRDNKTMVLYLKERRLVILGE